MIDNYIKLQHVILDSIKYAFSKILFRCVRFKSFRIRYSETV